MTWETLYNASAGPRVADSDGRTIGGSSFASGDTADPYTARQLDRGRLTVVETLNPVPEDGSIRSDAADAMRDVLERRATPKQAARRGRTATPTPADVAETGQSKEQ